MKKLMLMALVAMMLFGAKLANANVVEANKPTFETMKFIKVPNVDNFNDWKVWNTFYRPLGWPLSEFRAAIAKRNGKPNTEDFFRHIGSAIGVLYIPADKPYHKEVVETVPSSKAKTPAATIANVIKPQGKPALPKSLKSEDHPFSLPPAKGEVKTNDKKTSATPALAPKRMILVGPNQLAAVDSIKPQPSALKGVLDEAKIVRRNTYLESLVSVQDKEIESQDRALAVKDKRIKELEQDKFNSSFTISTYEQESREVQEDKREAQEAKRVNEERNFFLTLREISLIAREELLAQEKTAPKSAASAPMVFPWEKSYNGPLPKLSFWEYALGTLAVIGGLIIVLTALSRKMFAEPVNMFPIRETLAEADIQSMDKFHKERPIISSPPGVEVNAPRLWVEQT